MKISDELKAIAYKVANQVIERFRNKALTNQDEEQIVTEATMIKVGIDKIRSIIEEQNQSKKNEGIEITEDFILFMIFKRNHLFNRILYNFKSDCYESSTVELIITDWKENKNQFEGIEKYFNTIDEHFNNNAYYWYLHLKDKKLFSDLELPFNILSEYLYFIENFRFPITCVERLNKNMDDNELTKEQRLFIYDKINGLIANADEETQNNLSHINIEILDNRWNLEPYQDLNYEKYSIEYIAKEASKIDDYYERLKFLKHQKLEYERQAKELGWDIGLGDEIQIEIEVLEKVIKDNSMIPKSANSIKKASKRGKEKILFLSSNPSNTSRLRIDKEARDIEEGLRRANKRDSFDFEVKLATRSRDLSRAILDENPQILHFSGHGEVEGILLEDENGTSKIVTTEALSGLFSLFGDTIKCVILNSCYSESQAKEISRHIPFVIGMSKAVPDNTAISFSTSFYDAIGAGKEIEFAFKFAITNIGLEGLTGNQIPVLLKRD